MSRHTQTLTIQDALPVVSVSPRSHPERPHNVADETSREDPVKHDIVDVDGGHKTSDERPMTVRSMLPRKARHDANVTECTLAIGDFVYIRDRTWRGRNKIHDIWSPIVHVVICVPYDDDDDDNFIAIYMYITRHTCNGMRFAPELLHSMLPTRQSFHPYST